MPGFSHDDEIGHGRGIATRNPMHILISRILALVIIFSLSLANARQCLSLFQSLSKGQIEAAHVLKSLGRDEFNGKMPTVRRESLSSYEPFRSHPDYGDGSSIHIYIAVYRGKMVLIKQAKIEEARMAHALSQLGIGPKFIGLADHCDCYVMEFIPKALVIKKNRFDRRLNLFIENGFRLRQNSKDQIIQLIKYFASLGMTSIDFNFLIDSHGRIYVIDFDPKYMQTHDHSDSAEIAANLMIIEFQKQFLELEKRYPENKR